MRKSYMAFGAQVPSSPSSVLLLLLCQRWACTLLHWYHEIKKFNICVTWGLEKGLNFFPLPLFDRRSNQRSRSYLFECFCLVYMIKVRFAWWTDGAWSLARAVLPIQIVLPKRTRSYSSYAQSCITFFFFDIGHCGSRLVLTEVVVYHVLSRRVYTKSTECKILSIYNV